MVAVVLASFALAYPRNLPALVPQGKDLVDPAGRKVVLRGCNLGNWFVIEPWIINIAEGPGAVPDQYTLEETLSKRFGATEKDRLMELYRTKWIQEKDFATIKSFGFNLVRLPLNYRQFEDDAQPMKLRPDAWKWVDWAVDWAERQGIYTILDLHGAQGGQTENDHTGRSGQNKLWSDPKNQERMAWLWGEIAKRYRDRSAVLGYDVFNEPWGGSKADQVKVFTRCYESIRRNDPDKLVFIMGHWDNFDHYGDPKDRGWRNVAFQMHYYPGMFGNGSPNLLSQAKHIANLKEVAAKVDRLNVPFLVGEMNVVFDSSGGAKMMRRYYDLHAQYGWMTTVWTYKVLSKEGGFGNASWGMVTNAKPMRALNVHTDSKTQIEAWIDGLDKGFVAWSALREAMTAAHVEQPPLPELPKPRTTAPDDAVWPGWTSTDIGGALKGGLVKKSDASFELYGGGNDIWGAQDDFRFLNIPVTGDFDLTVTIDDLEEVDTYTKAGLMLRADAATGSPMVLVSTFPSGEVQFVVRQTANGQAAASGSGQVTFPGAQFRLQRQGNLVTAWAGDKTSMKQIGSTTWQGPKAAMAGPVALSHAASRLAKVAYSNLAIKQKK